MSKMRIVFILLLAFCQKNGYCQDGSLLQDRLKTQPPETHDNWSADITESTIVDTNFIVRSIKLEKNLSGLVEIESYLKQESNSFFDIDIYPIERIDIINYGQAIITVFNQRRREEQKFLYNYIITEFSTTSYIYLLASKKIDGQEAFVQGTIKYKNEHELSINIGANKFKFEPASNLASSRPTPLNDLKTVWNENGLKGKVKEIFTKKYELDSDDPETKTPLSLYSEEYDQKGQLIHSKEIMRSGSIESNLTGTFTNRNIRRFDDYQNLNIVTVLKVTEDKATAESKVENKTLNKTEYEYLNGRIIKASLRNYLNELEKEIIYSYNSDGHLHSVSTTLPKQDIGTIELFNYLNFDDQGNWTERISYNSQVIYNPKHLEIREITYF